MGSDFALAAGRIGAGPAILMSTIRLFCPVGDRHCVAQICGESCAVHVRTAVQASIVALFLLCAFTIHRIAEPPTAMMHDMHERVIQLEMEHVPSTGDRHRTMFTGIVRPTIAAASAPLWQGYVRRLVLLLRITARDRSAKPSPSRLSRGLSPR
jgi:hypothetical protein